MILRLLDVGFGSVEFHVTLADGNERLVRVEVGAGTDWLRAVRFPNLNTDAGATLGDETLDREVRERASEELVRLEAAVNLAAGRWAA
jgi:hypothetical protein